MRDRKVMHMETKSGPLTFFSNFDSGNLARVERVKRDINSTSDVIIPTSQSQNAGVSPSASFQEQNLGTSLGFLSLAPDFEYNLWTSPDCAGTSFENSNRTWFYFGVKGCQAGKLVKFSIMNMNKQGRLYNQGMTPLVKVVPGRNKWERIRDRPSYEVRVRIIFKFESHSCEVFIVKHNFHFLNQKIVKSFYIQLARLQSMSTGNLRFLMKIKNIVHLRSCFCQIWPFNVPSKLCISLFLTCILLLCYDWLMMQTGYLFCILVLKNFGFSAPKIKTAILCSLDNCPLRSKHKHN